MDRIFIKDLACRCIIGVNPEDRREKQDVIINIALWADLRPAGLSDLFTDTVDYRGIKKRVIALVEKSEYQLVEALAENIAQACLLDPRVHQVQVAVEKPAALRFARSVGVEVTRTRA